MKIKLKSTLKTVFPLLLGVVLVWYSLSKVSFSQIFFYFKQANIYWIVLSIFLGILSHISRAYRWRFQLEPLGFKVKLLNRIMAVFAMYLINYTLPRAGDVARASILSNYENVPFEKGFGTIVAERVIDTLIMLVIIIIALCLHFDILLQFLVPEMQLFKLVIVGLVALLAVGVLYMFLKQSTLKIALKIKSFVLGLAEGVLSIFKMQKKSAFVLHSIFIWAMYLLMFYSALLAFPDLKHTPIAVVLLGFISASFSIAATNGGIGSYPLAIYAAFAMFNIPEAPSIAFGWIMWTSQTVLNIVFGGLSLIMLPLYNQKYTAND